MSNHMNMNNMNPYMSMGYNQMGMGMPMNNMNMNYQMNTMNSMGYPINYGMNNMYGNMNMNMNMGQMYPSSMNQPLQPNQGNQILPTQTGQPQVKKSTPFDF